MSSKFFCSWLITMFCFLILLNSKAQQSDKDTVPTILVKGKVVGSNRISLMGLMVVNKRTQHGIIGDPSGNFEIKILKNDTLLIGALGYKTGQISFVDSALKREYNCIVRLKSLSVDLRQVEVFSERDLEEIQEEIETLGVDPSEFEINRIDPISSPITYLYHLLSRKERSKRQVVILENEERKRDLLKELFRKYVDAEIINLSTEDFDDFIDFCEVPDVLLKELTQYEFVMLIKHKFGVYKEMKN